MAVIAVDCDDVLVRTADYFVRAYNDTYGTAVDYETHHLASYDGEWESGDEAEFADRLEFLRNSRAYRQLGLSDEAKSVLQQLSVSHTLHLVTARLDREKDDTFAMLDRDVPGVFTEFHFVGWSGSKGEAVKSIGADYLIDDNVKHLESALQAGLPDNGAILFGDYPWNRQPPEDKRIFRCRDWLSVLERIGSRE